MESLFRFAVVRPPTAVAADHALPLTRDTELQQELRIARGRSRPRTSMRAIVDKFVADGEIVSVATLNHGKGFAAMRAEIADATSVQALAERISTWFGLAADQLSSSPELVADDARVADSLVALKIATGRQLVVDMVALADVIRHVSLIRRVAAGDAMLDRPSEIARARRSPLVLPPQIFPLPSDPKSIGTSPIPGPRPDLEALRGEVAELHRATEELMAIDASAVIGEGNGDDSVDGQDQASDNRPSVQRRTSPLILSAAAAKALTAQTQAVVKARGLDLATSPLDRAVNALFAHLGAASRALAQAEAVQVPRKAVGLVGRTPVAIPIRPWGPASGPPLAAIPSSHGTVRTVGVADLLVVKQNLDHYEARDIAHIENVLRGESKGREHLRSVVTEQLTVSEFERVREEERELESTERFEMGRATSETISELASLVTGLTVSGSYGPTVDFEAGVQGALEQARERSVEVASSYSRDVTERSRARLSETVRELRSLRVVNTVSETNEHKIDNTAGPDHVVGIYQWLEKVYEAQIFNYGLRALFDFTIPEPAAFSIHAMQSGFADATQVTRPREFDITPAQITEWNYHQYVRDWEATGVSPPPETFVTVTKTFRGGPDGPEGDTRGMFVDGVELPLPEGYRAVSAVVVCRFGHWDSDPDMSIKLTVGGRTHAWTSGGGTTWSTALDNEVTTIPVAVRTWRASSFTAACELTCQRTQRALDKWRLETHAILLQAFQQRRAAYEEALKALRARAGVEIAGRNPAANRDLELRELKKACIEVLTAQHFELFDAIETGIDGLPQTNVPEAALEGPYVRFFEQAFEWHNATYVFYPYYWGRRSAWVDRFQYDDADPLFTAFLRAGAARVVVPVRPGFELLIDHFMTTGEVWQGSELPPMTSSTYVPIIEELAEQLGAPGTEVAQGEPWKVSVPTSLVLLRATSTLPGWHKTENGNWVSNDT